MTLLKYIKHFVLFLLTFLLGVQTSHAKTGLVLPQNQVSFSIENTQSFQSLEKEVQPNIGFLKEKSKFELSDSVSAQNTFSFSRYFVGKLAEAGGSLFKVGDNIAGFVVNKIKNGTNGKIAIVGRKMGPVETVGNSL